MIHFSSFIRGYVMHQFEQSPIMENDDYDEYVCMYIVSFLMYPYCVTMHNVIKSRRVINLVNIPQTSVCVTSAMRILLYPVRMYGTVLQSLIVLYIWMIDNSIFKDRSDMHFVHVCVAGVDGGYIMILSIWCSWYCAKIRSLFLVNYLTN